MDIFEQAHNIIESENRSDWVTDEIPSNVRLKDVESAWKFMSHPPAIQDGNIRICDCNCRVLTLANWYKDEYPYWCYHCGPQATARRID